MAWFHLHLHLRNAFIPHEGNDYHPHAVRKNMLRIYAGSIVAVKVAAILFIGFASQPARVSDVTPTNIVKLTNNERRIRNIAVLHSNALLNRAAQSKAQDMLSQQYFAHISPSNITPWYWFKQAGYSYQYAGENLAIDFVQSEDIIKAWLNSPSHRKNLLSTKYHDIGVAVVSGKFKGATSIIVVQMFGTATPKPATKVASMPTQVPSPTVVKQQLAVAPAVLGEQTPAPAPEPVIPPAEPQPPMIPTIDTPEAGSFINTGMPTVVGLAEPASAVELIVDEETVAVAVAPHSGIYSLIPSLGISDGQHQLSVRSSARGLTATSLSRLVTFDSSAPSVKPENSYALMSLGAPDSYDVLVATSDDAVGVRCNCGATTDQLVRESGRFVGQVRLENPSPSTGVLKLYVRDQVGNETSLAFSNTDLYTTGVVAASEGPIVRAFQALDTSRMILTLFLIAALIVALIHVFVHLEHQRQPTVIGLLMVAYLAGTLLIL